MTTMSDRLEKYRKFAVTGVIPVIATAKPSKSAAFFAGRGGYTHASARCNRCNPERSGYQRLQLAI